MKRIVNYKTFINESAGSSELTAEQIDFLSKYVRGKWKLNDEGFVDVDGNFDCTYKGISDFKRIKFGKISRDFDCSHNSLTSLEGCPKEVNGHFDCSYNKLTSLEFGPKEVNRRFDCSNNKLTSLEGCPEKVNGDFNCSYNNLTSLEGGPEMVNMDFICYHNNLISLKGVPKKVGGSLWCYHNVGLSTEIINLIFSNMLSTKSDYKTVLKSLWREITIEDKILLYTPDLDWVEEKEASKLLNLKKYSNIKKMI